MSERIVRVGSLEEFRREVKESKAMPELRPFCALPAVRLSLTDQWAGGSTIPKKDLRLTLQGINDLGEIVWLVENHTIVCFPSGPETPGDASIAEGMRTAYDLVKEHLTALGYEVRGGSYGIPEDIHPVMGGFECVCWRKTGEDTWSVERLGLSGWDPWPPPSPAEEEGDGGQPQGTAPTETGEGEGAAL